MEPPSNPDANDAANPKYPEYTEHHGAGDELRAQWIVEECRQVVRTREPDHGEQHQRYHRENVGRQASLRRKRFDAPMQLESPADHCRDSLERLGEVATGLLLDQNGGDERHDRNAWHPLHQPQHGTTHITAIVDLSKDEFEFPSDRFLHVFRHELQTLRKGMPGLESALDHIERLRKLLVEFRHAAVA